MRPSFEKTPPKSHNSLRVHFSLHETFISYNNYLATVYVDMVLRSKSDSEHWLSPFQKLLPSIIWKVFTSFWFRAKLFGKFDDFATFKTIFHLKLGRKNRNLLSTSFPPRDKKAYVREARAYRRKSFKKWNMRKGKRTKKLFSVEKWKRC